MYVCNLCSHRCSQPPAAPCALVQDYLYTGVPLGPPRDNTATASDCCAACRAVAAHECVAFSFTPTNKRCQLLKAVGGGTRVVGAVSGSPASMRAETTSNKEIVCVCLYAYVFVCICICMHMCLYAYVFICMCMCVVFMSMQVYTYTYVRIDILNMIDFA